VSEPAWKAEFRSLGELLRTARENAGLTHLELSQHSGIRSRKLRLAESGNRREWSKLLVEGILGSLPPSPELASLAQRWRQYAVPRAIRKLSSSAKFPDRFPDLLREARENAGLSIRKLARLAGIDAAYLSKMERKQVPPPKWTKIAAIASHLPLSGLAKQAAVSGKEELKQSMLEQIGDIEKLIFSLPGATFGDQVWVSEIQARLRKCMMLITASEDAAANESTAVTKKAR
jgi:transcriptional regulator with XRE-family HTH domain